MISSTSKARRLMYSAVFLYMSISLTFMAVQYSSYIWQYFSFSYCRPNSGRQNIALKRQHHCIAIFQSLIVSIVLFLSFCIQNLDRSLSLPIKFSELYSLGNPLMMILTVITFRNILTSGLAILVVFNSLEAYSLFLSYIVAFSRNSSTF